MGNQIDYGARAYDPRVGKWLSTGPKGSKYPGYSPYVYSANNPALFIDQDGEDWIVSTTTNKKTGVTTINITVNAKIANNSSQPIDMKNLIKNVKANVERLYSGSDPAKKLNCKMTVNLEEYKVDKSNHQSNLKGSDHFIELLDDSHFNTPKIKGYSFQGGLYIALKRGEFDNKGKTDDTQLVPHELGHTGGLYHPWEVGDNPAAVNGKQLLSPRQNDEINTGALDYTFMAYSSKLPEGSSVNPVLVVKNPQPATVGQIKDIKLNADKGNLNGNNTVTGTGKVIEKRNQPKDKKD